MNRAKNGSADSPFNRFAHQLCSENELISASLMHWLTLETVLRARPAVNIVISSTWRTTRTLAELRALFSDGIARRIIAVTPQWTEVQDDDSWGAYMRQAEIEAWLRANGRPWEDWVAVDDQPALFRPFCKAWSRHVLQLAWTKLHVPCCQSD